MGKIHCKTCTCEESSRPRTGEFTCPNCFRPNNSEGWLRYHLKNQCEVSPARARVAAPTGTLTAAQYIAKYGDPTFNGPSDKEYLATFGRPPDAYDPDFSKNMERWRKDQRKKTNMRMDPTRW